MNGSNFFDYIAVAAIVYVIYIIVKGAKESNERKQTQENYRQALSYDRQKSIEEAVRCIEQARNIAVQYVPSILGEKFSDYIYFGNEENNEDTYNPDYDVIVQSFSEYTSEKFLKWSKAKDVPPFWRYTTGGKLNDGTDSTRFGVIKSGGTAGGKVSWRFFESEVVTALKAKYPTWEISDFDTYVSIKFR